MSPTTTHRIGLTLFLFGTTTVIGWQLLAWLDGSKPTSTEFPLGRILDVAVDAHGRVYVASGFFGRVQRYSADGRFERGWRVPTAGVFALRTTADGRLEVATARANKLLTYTPDGELLNEVSGDDLYSAYASERDTTGPYRVQGGFLPRIVDEQTGQTIIKSSWTRRLTASPFPATAYSWIGVGLIAIAEWTRRRRLRRLVRGADPAEPATDRQ